MTNSFILSFIFLSTSVLSLFADTASLNFNFQHGTVITNQYNGGPGGDFGITISTVNSGSGPDVGLVYDTELGGEDGIFIDGADPDLERLVVEGAHGDDDNHTGWDGGNLPNDFNAGGVLIIQENAIGVSDGGNFTGNKTYSGNGTTVTSASGYDPDDDADGGIFTFTIDPSFTYTGFSIVLADFEEEGDNYIVNLTGREGGSLEQNYNDITGENTPPFGNNFISELPFVSLGTGEALSKFSIEFKGVSGSIDSIFLVPEPSPLLMIGLAGLAVGACCMFRRFRS